MLTENHLQWPQPAKQHHLATSCNDLHGQMFMPFVRGYKDALDLSNGLLVHPRASREDRDIPFHVVHLLGI